MYSRVSQEAAFFIKFWIFHSFFFLPPEREKTCFAFFLSPASVDPSRDAQKGGKK